MFASMVLLSFMSPLSFASPPSESSVIAERTALCEQSRVSDPDRDCSEDAIKKALAQELAEHVQKTTEQNQIQREKVAQEDLIYKETLRCKKMSGVICESPTGRRVQLALSCPRGWTLVNANQNRDCSPEAIRKLVLQKGQDKQWDQLPNIGKIQSDANSRLIVQDAEDPHSLSERKMERQKSIRILLGTLIISLILALLYRVTLNFGMTFWISILKGAITIISSVGSGVVAFRWELETFAEIAGPSESLAGMLGIFPPLFALGAVSSFVAIGLILTFWPPKTTTLLRNPAINLASFIGGFVVGSVAGYLYIQKIATQPLHYSSRFQTALTTTIYAPIIFLFVATLISLLLAKLLGGGKKA